MTLAGCNTKKEPEAAKLGEPIGVRVDDVKDASGKKLGSLTGAFAITKGQAAEPLVPGMARVLDRVGKNCPALFAKGADPMHAIGKTSAGVLVFSTPTPGASETPEQRCFREAMDKQRVSEDADRDRHRSRAAARERVAVTRASTIAAFVATLLVSQAAVAQIDPRDTPPPPPPPPVTPAPSTTPRARDTRTDDDGARGTIASGYGSNSSGEPHWTPCAR